jgi:AMP deaminase
MAGSEIEANENDESIQERHANVSLAQITRIKTHTYGVPEEQTKLPPLESQTELQVACNVLLDLLDLRGKYIFYDEELTPPPLINAICNTLVRTKVVASLADPALEVAFQDGVCMPMLGGEAVDIKVVTKAEFYQDLRFLISAMHSASTKTFCFQRLSFLEKMFEMHLMVNKNDELREQQLIPHRDFYNTPKVDNHVHLSAAMNQKHLQRFIKDKLKSEPTTVVIASRGHTKTLKDVFDELRIDAFTLSVDMLNCYADASTFQRFDRFNAKYSPLGQPSLREIFMKTDNLIRGRYFAEVVKEVLAGLDKYTLAEYRVSIYGKSYDEWLKLSQWFLEFDVQSPSATWMIQLPRLFKIYRMNGSVGSFQEMLHNIFSPLFEATLRPEANPEIATFMKRVVGLDTVDDESTLEKVSSLANYKVVQPQDWTVSDNPPYSYWSYYIYANLNVLNHIRRARGLNTFAFRPHCGEAGSLDHLATAFLTAHSINHGIELRKIPVLQYLFYLKQIGMSMSPNSNNKLFLKYSKNPFPKFLNRGLNVTLSTDDPLMIHLTKEPLLEEYSVATQVWSLNQVDLAEIARNSMLQSGFPHTLKQKWMGSDYLSGSPESVEPHHINLSRLRYTFRYQAFITEMDHLLVNSSQNRP